MNKDLVKLAIDKSITNITKNIWSSTKEIFQKQQELAPAMFLGSVPYEKMKPLSAKDIEKEDYIMPSIHMIIVDLSEYFTEDRNKDEVAYKMKMSVKLAQNPLFMAFISEAFVSEKHISEMNDKYVPPSEDENRKNILMFQVETPIYIKTKKIHIESDFSDMTMHFSGKYIPKKHLDEKSEEEFSSDKGKDKKQMGRFANVFPEDYDYDNVIKRILQCQ